MEKSKETEIIFGKIDNCKIAEKVHSSIISSDKTIDYRIFPIYVRYSREDKVVAILYFKGKFVNPKEVVLGLNLEEKPKLLGFKDAKYMKDSNMTYSYIIKDSIDSKKFISKIVKLI